MGYFTDQDSYLFHEGTNYESYRALGARRFRTRALLPNVSVPTVYQTRRLPSMMPITQQRSSYHLLSAHVRELCYTIAVLQNHLTI